MYNYQKPTASLLTSDGRTIKFAEGCVLPWEDGQILEEGKDFEIQKLVQYNIGGMWHPEPKDVNNFLIRNRRIVALPVQSGEGKGGEINKMKAFGYELVFIKNPMMKEGQVMASPELLEKLANVFSRLPTPTDGDYWRKRCLASELVLSNVPTDGTVTKGLLLGHQFKEAVSAWQQLKQQQP